MVKSTAVKKTPMAVQMTTGSLLAVLTPLIHDLSQDLPHTERFRRLLESFLALFPGDAAALLRLDGDTLVPLATNGLSSDTLGRRFRVADHPRFVQLLSRSEPMRFPADSTLPDPYDGLVEGVRGELRVHDCLGCPMFVGGRVWGLLTLDALDPARFDDVDMPSLRAFLSLASATVSVVQRIDALERQGEVERQRAEAFQHAHGGHSRRELIGSSDALKQLVNDIDTVASSDLTVLITGETGVGKELVASALHTLSPRANRPLITVNCAALPDSLVESELFGHVRGAFSGAVSDRGGKFELADGGTLFLDEVGELPLAVQAKLLRVLQNGQLQRIGSDREHAVDVRLIAATNRDLGEEVRAGRFRADLYHRLTVFPLRVPPLRERGRDVLLLAGSFLEENRARLGLSSLRVSADAQAALLTYSWPGNVRELEHLIARSALKALSTNRNRQRIVSITAADMALHSVHPDAQALSAPAAVNVNVNANANANVPQFREAVASFERTLLLNTFALHKQNWASTARALGLDRANLNRLAKRLALK